MASTQASTHQPTPPARARLPLDRAQRSAAILAAIPAVPDGGFTGVVDAVVELTWQRSVVARAREVAPALLTSTFFTTKLRAGFSTYCALGMSAIACSRTRPRSLSRASSVARALGLTERAIGSVARPLMPWMFRVFCAKELDLLACASAFILVIDEIFDDELSHLSRAARVDWVGRIARQESAHDSPAGALARALVDTLARSSPERWQRAAARLAEWADAEVRLEAGDPDVEPRKAGIDVSMELLAFAAPAYVGDRELSWMQGIARLGQMVDDVVDAEKDLETGRVTPGATGQWDVDTVAALYAKLVDDTRSLVCASGERYEATLAVYESTFRAQIRHMAQVLVEHP